MAMNRWPLAFGVVVLVVTTGCLGGATGSDPPVTNSTQGDSDGSGTRLGHGSIQFRWHSFDVNGSEFSYSGEIQFDLTPRTGRS